MTSLREKYREFVTWGSPDSQRYESADQEIAHALGLAALMGARPARFLDLRELNPRTDPDKREHKGK